MSYGFISIILFLLLSGPPDHVLVAVEGQRVCPGRIIASQPGEKVEAAVVGVPASHLPASLLRGRNTFQCGGGIHVKRGCLMVLFSFPTNVDV